MSIKNTVAAALAATLFALPALAGGPIEVEDAYARSSTSMSKSGAAFMLMTNTSGADDRLIAARSPAAAKVELHTHIEGDGGVMRMTEIEGGIAIADGETHVFQRGGDHLMFMGLKHPFEDGETVPVTLVFEKAGEVEIEVPVDLTRKPDHKMKHGS